MATTPEQMLEAHEGKLTDMQTRLQFATDQIQVLNKNLESQQQAHAMVKLQMDRHITELQRKIGNPNVKDKGIKLIDPKAFTPHTFSGMQNEHFKPWAQKICNFCNSQCHRFRRAMEWVGSRTIAHRPGLAGMAHLGT